MMYPFLTLDDETEITHSDVLQTGRLRSMWRSQMKKIVFTFSLAICRTIR